MSQVIKMQDNRVMVMVPNRNDLKPLWISLDDLLKQTEEPYYDRAIHWAFRIIGHDSIYSVDDFDPELVEAFKLQHNDMFNCIMPDKFVIKHAKSKGTKMVLALGISEKFAFDMATSEWLAIHASDLVLDADVTKGPTNKIVDFVIPVTSTLTVNAFAKWIQDSMRISNLDLSYVDAYSMQYGTARINDANDLKKLNPRYEYSIKDPIYIFNINDKKVGITYEPYRFNVSSDNITDNLKMLEKIRTPTDITKRVEQVLHKARLRVLNEKYNPDIMYTVIE